MATEIVWRGTENLPVPVLGLTTTRDLLKELEARVDIQELVLDDAMTKSYLRALSGECRTAIATLSDEILNYRTVDES